MLELQKEENAVKVSEFQIREIEGLRMYNVGGVDYPSITTVLKYGAPNPKLESFFVNNSKNKIEEVRKKTSDFGIEAHRCFEQILLGQKPDVFNEQMKIVVDQFYKFKDEHNLKAIHLEKTVFSELYGYAGTADFIGYCDGELMVIDWKTSSRYSITNSWQMAAQRLAAMECLNIKNPSIMGVQISRTDGSLKTFKVDHIDFCTEHFLHALEVFKGLMFYRLEKMGYLYTKQNVFIKYMEKEHGYHKRAY